MYGGRHFISMEERKVITIGDVMDLTVMHINKGNAHGTQGERSNPDSSQHTRLLRTCFILLGYTGSYISGY